MYILETNLLLITSVANTLPYSKGCLFILFFGFLCYAKAFKFIRSNVLIFLFIFITVGDGSKNIILFSSVTQLCPTLCNPMDCSTPGFPVRSPIPRAYSNSCPSSQWCHPTIWSSVIPFSYCLQSFPASGPFLMSWLFASGHQSIGASASASVLPMNIQDWFPLLLTGLISLQSKGLSRIFSNTKVQKHQ